MPVLSNDLFGVSRGFQVLYHDGEPNHCPGCNQQQWYVGRMTAECAFCATAIPREAIHAMEYLPQGPRHRAPAGSPLVTL